MGVDDKRANEATWAGAALGAESPGGLRAQAPDGTPAIVEPRKLRHPRDPGCHRYPAGHRDVSTHWQPGLVVHVVFALCLPLGAMSMCLADGEAGGKSPRSDAGTGIVVDKGVLKNLDHGFRFLVPEGWSIAEGVTADEMSFSADGCDECELRVIVSPGNTLPLMDTVRAIREQIQKDPGALIAGEEPVKVARETAYTIVKEETKGGAPAPDEPKGSAPGAKPAPRKPAVVVRTRYVTFLHGTDKYYLLLRAPKDRFGSDDAAFEKLLAKFRFEPGS